MEPVNPIAGKLQVLYHFALGVFSYYILFIYPNKDHPKDFVSMFSVTISSYYNVSH